MAAESKGVNSEVTEINEIEAIWEAQEAEEISERETEAVEEIKEAKGLEKSANQPLSDSPSIVESKEIFHRALDLPPELLGQVFSFFKPKELASIVPLSKKFLTAANTRTIRAPQKTATSYDFGFMPGANTELDRLIREAAKDPSFTALHRTLLQPWYQITASQRQLFLRVRGEILAGRLSLSRAIEEIDALANVSTDFGRSELLLAKRLAAEWRPLAADQQSWQEKALACGLTFTLLCSDWMDEATATRLSEQFTVDQLKGLSEYQVKGLASGLTYEQVTAAGFTRLHVEAHRAAPALRAVLEGGLTAGFAPEDWRRRFDTADASGQRPSPLRSLPVTLVWC